MTRTRTKTKMRTVRGGVDQIGTGIAKSRKTRIKNSLVVVVVVVEDKK